nr:MAG TPA: hypothetical protein [Caudoviricetes sp.]
MPSFRLPDKYYILCINSSKSRPLFCLTMFT